MKMSSSKTAPWSLGLLSSMADPHLLLITTRDAVVIKDKYPKAQHHYLVLPKEDIPSIFHLSKKHLGLLSELHLLAQNTIEVVGGEKVHFKVGFHARPSMQRLHLHVISTDFNSTCMKTKKHWNSFNSNLFLPYESVFSELESRGFVQKLSKDVLDKLEKSEIKCNKCNYFAKTMPDLKSHIVIHYIQNK